MIKIENTEVVGWEATIRGMRNPKNSWDRSDSDCVHCMNFDPSSERDCETCDVYIGPNDLDLMMRLAKGGPVHAKYLRYIDVYVDVTAPLYWWKEFETYRIGVAENPSDIEMNSCSTMHKIHDKEFTLEDFSCEHLIIESEKERLLNWSDVIPMHGLHIIIRALNESRIKYLQTNDKRYWWQMIQLLPSSYNQKRTLKMNYQVLAGLYPMRKNHKLDEWREFCDWIETLPYSEIITGKSESEEE